MSLSSDLILSLRQAIAGEIRADPITRLLYSTDASIYQIEPLGVVFPRQLDDLNAIVEIATAHETPVLARGAGSSLAGQAIGKALIVDCSRYLNRQIDIHPETMSATVEPGVVLDDLNRAAAVHGLQFGPDPASAERATIGGSLANNATGAHSIVYGMAADHLLSAEVVLSDGSLATFEPTSLDEACRRTEGRDVQSAIYAAALRIRSDYAEAIRKNWPRTWRRASGYSLNYLLPWSPSQPPEWGKLAAYRFGAESSENPQSTHPYPPISGGHLNLAPLLCGSEGTLAIIRRATVRLVPKPRHTVLGVLAYASIVEACDAVPALLERHPSAIELIPWQLISRAQSVPAYAHMVSFVDQLTGSQREPTLLVVEFSGDDPASLVERVRCLRPDVLLAESRAAQQQIWAVRKVGLGILQSQPGDLKPLSFIEDLAVPVERLGEFVREMERIMSAHHVQCDYYAHASAGCLHIRPVLNLKTPKGVTDLRSIAAQAVTLTLRLGGSVSGEHGDGLARSEWLRQAYGPEIMTAFRELKQAADPKRMLNPTKKLDPLMMDENLRFGADYRTRGWQPALSFSSQGGMASAIELCNGAGVCRKSDGVMCPSFQATGDEMFSTRGRANLMRAILSGRKPSSISVSQLDAALHASLELCLACKGCKAECPSAVDMAKLKYEFTHQYFESHRRKLRDYLFAYIATLAKLGSPFAPLVNAFMRSRLTAGLAKRWLDLAPQRAFPRLKRPSFRSPRPGFPDAQPVLFLSDAFTEYFHPEIGLAAIEVLEAVGCHVIVLPVIGAGRTLISKGLLEPARRHARQVVTTIGRLDPEGRTPIVGVEPSEVYTLRDEYLDLFPQDEGVKALAKRAWMIDEYLLRPGAAGESRLMRIATYGSASPPRSPISNSHILLHGHCYQKAQPPAADGYPTGAVAAAAMLEQVGYRVSLVEAGCCGMAGAFGYESEHYQLSMAIGELALFPAVRRAEQDSIIAASGVSCREQIEAGAERTAVHPITLVAAVV